EQGGLDPIGLREHLPNGLEHPRVVAGLLRRDPLIGAWSIITTPSRPRRDPSMRLLLPDPATPVTTVSTPRGTSTSIPRRLCEWAPRISSAPADSRTVPLSSAVYPRWRPVSVSESRRPSTVPV